jgi:SAM-dependent methyltransferase
VPDRSKANELSQQYLNKGDPLGWFEALYAQAKSDPSTIPWADLAPNPNLIEWLDARRVDGAGHKALVVGCGLGDDADALAQRGFEVTAFDISPTAIDWCRRRYPQSKINFVTADATNPPPEWRGAFDFILESYTLQAIPTQLRRRAQAAIVDLLAPQGILLIICRARESDEPADQPPWPLTRSDDLSLFVKAGLREESFEDYLDEHEDPPIRRFRAVYRRA